jgi:hypothetical protein
MYLRFGVQVLYSASHSPRQQYLVHYVEQQHSSSLQTNFADLPHVFREVVLTLCRNGYVGARRLVYSPLESLENIVWQLIRLIFVHTCSHLYNCVIVRTECE